MNFVFVLIKYVCDHDAPTVGSICVASETMQLLEFVALQRSIFSSALQYMKPSNGRIVYITCSILDEENVHQVNRARGVKKGRRYLDSNFKLWPWTTLYDPCRRNFSASSTDLFSRRHLSISFQCQKAWMVSFVQYSDILKSRSFVFRNV